MREVPGKISFSNETVKNDILLHHPYYQLALAKIKRSILLFGMQKNFAT